MKQEALYRAYELGHTAAMLNYRKRPNACVNPYAHKALHREWRRGWMAGCDEVNFREALAAKANAKPETKS